MCPDTAALTQQRITLLQTGKLPKLNSRLISLNSIFSTYSLLKVLLENGNILFAYGFLY